MASPDESQLIPIQTLLDGIDPGSLKWDIKKGLRFTVDLTPPTWPLRLTSDVRYEGGRVRLDSPTFGLNVAEAVRRLTSGNKTKNAIAPGTQRRNASIERFPASRWTLAAIGAAGVGAGYLLFGDSIVAGTLSWVRFGLFVSVVLAIASPKIRDAFASLYRGAALLIGTLAIAGIAGQLLLPELFPTLFNVPNKQPSVQANPGKLKRSPPTQR